ncbi:unnamed protein product, partial [Scytosiphon promiscuus]
RHFAGSSGCDLVHSFILPALSFHDGRNRAVFVQVPELFFICYCVRRCLVVERDRLSKLRKVEVLVGCWLQACAWRGGQAGRQPERKSRGHEDIKNARRSY